MADEKSFWWHVRVGVTVGVIVLVITSLVTAWKWDVVKPFATALGDWLTADSRLMNVSVVVLLLVIGGAVWLILNLRSALASERARTRHPVPALPDVAVVDARPKPEPAVAPAPDVADDPDSMEGYFSGARALRGRFAEREEYLRRCRGKAVRWRGTVRNVRGFSDNSVVIYLLGKSGQPTLTCVNLPATFRERALALPPGDSVLVTGRITEGNEDIVQIDGDGFELVKRCGP